MVEGAPVKVRHLTAHFVTNMEDEAASDSRRWTILDCGTEIYACGSNMFCQIIDALPSEENSFLTEPTKVSATEAPQFLSSEHDTCERNSSASAVALCLWDRIIFTDHGTLGSFQL